MSYKIYTDKNENFECEVSVKNASLKGSIARLVVESSDGPTLIFKGTLNGDKCIIPIKRLKGLLEENTHGKMHLEVIVEDTYFKPWESDFIVEEHTSVKVKVNEQKELSNKPIVEVKVPIQKKSSINLSIPKKELINLCEKFGIRKNNLKRKHKDFIQILKEYFRINTEYNKHTKVILNGLQNFLR